MRKEQIRNVLNGLKPALLMVVVQFAFAAANVLYKLAANDGMNLKIIIAYRFIFATAFMVPLAFIVERKSRPKLTWTVIIQAFLCGLFGCSLAQNLYIESLALISATFASAMGNLIPAATFILAILFGMERMELASLKGRAKVTGTLMGIGGAMLLTFYKGIEVNIWSTNINLLHHGRSHVASSHDHRRVLGFFMALCNCLSYALWLIIQGMVGSGLMVMLISWCLRIKGPLFVSIFNPLMLVLVAIAGSLVLDEKLHLGSILGAMLIVCGLYVVLWGKNKETKKTNELAPSEIETCQEAEITSIIVTSRTKGTCVRQQHNKETKKNDKLAPSEIETSHEAEITSIIVTSPTKDTCVDDNIIDRGSSEKEI